MIITTTVSLSAEVLYSEKDTEFIGMSINMARTTSLFGTFNGHKMLLTGLSASGHPY